MYGSRRILHPLRSSTCASVAADSFEAASSEPVFIALASVMSKPPEPRPAHPIARTPSNSNADP